MKIKKIASSAGSYRLVNETVFGHMISTLEDYGERSQNPLIPMLIDQAISAEEVEVEHDDGNG